MVEIQRPLVAVCEPECIANVIKRSVKIIRSIDNLF